MTLTFVLGASDPEMIAIENLLHECRQDIRYVTQAEIQLLSSALLEWRMTCTERYGLSIESRYAQSRRHSDVIYPIRPVLGPGFEAP